VTFLHASTIDIHAMKPHISAIWITDSGTRIWRCFGITRTIGRTMVYESYSNCPSEALRRWLAK
jgi:hypothetical protein